MKNWIKFGEKLPKIGENINIKFDNGKEFPNNPYGIIKRITNIKDLDADQTIVMEKRANNAWSLSSDKFVNSIVKDNYYWNTEGIMND